VFAEKYGNPSSNNWALDWGGNTWWEWSPKFAHEITGPASKFLYQPTITYCDSTPGGGSFNICSKIAETAHTGGMNVAMADGSVRGIAPQISPLTWWAACTPNGGEQLGNDWAN